MKQFWIITISCAVLGNVSPSQDVLLSLPENLTIGVSSAAYQIEGAWNVGGKGESIWDRWTHSNPEPVTAGDNGDIATNFYYKYKEDVQLMKSIGLEFFRFSISWPRVLPTGFTNAISKDGLQFYKNLTAELRANGIEPVVTLYHWDHPQILEDFGGWTNELMIDWFVSYAEVIFEALGDSVKIWTTFNEVNLFCQNAYGRRFIRIAPDKPLADIGKYMCVHNILKAHAKTYHMYNERFRATQQGEIGLVGHCPGYVAANSSDTESVETDFQFECGWIYNPIVNGDYPEIMKTRIAAMSKAQGYETSRLPEFSAEWISLIKGTFDHIGLNHYGTVVVSSNPEEAQIIYYNTDSGIGWSAKSSWPSMIVPGLYVVPTGFREMLRQIRDKYDNPPVRIFEIGYPDFGKLDDYDRIKYHRDYLTELIKAMKEDGCNVKSYSIWSLLDDFEWISYKLKFGIFKVDFNDPDRPRTPRLSASWWKIVLRNRELQPIPYTMNKSWKLTAAKLMTLILVFTITV